MPIQTKDLGKYNRPGIFINEIDQSIIELPVQDVLINLVPGFSKKGPVNSPTYISNPTDFIKIFGDIDKGLERKGSYFHRTCLKMLESGPIWALNLLVTDDTRDFLNWKSISSASQFSNGISKTMPYSRIFNRQDFWVRDEESFLDYINDPTPETEKLLTLTNMGTKTITTFIYKSSVTGFDVYAEDWYGGVSKMPQYLRAKDYVSDYMVSVLILQGDWTNYSTLSVDPTWGQYFTSSGLIKGNVQAFVDEQNVTVLGYYDSSLIPYFRDANGLDMYIKANINNDTNKTGLFCAYNEDSLLSADCPTNTIDLLGEGIINGNTNAIDFLSYNESIVENLTYNQQNLDEINNACGNYASNLSTTYSPTTRTASNTEGFVYGLGFDFNYSGQTLVPIVSAQTFGTSWLKVNPYAADQDILLVNDVVYFTGTAYDTIKIGTPYYVVNVASGSTIFTISETEGGSPITISASTVSNLYVQSVKLKTTFASDPYFVLGSAYTFNTGTTLYTYEPLTFTTAPTLGLNRYDVLYLSKGDEATINILKGTQSSSSASKPAFGLDPTQYIILGYVHHNVVTSSTALNFNVETTYTPVSNETTFAYAPYTGITASGQTVGTTNYIKLTFENTSGITDLTNYLQIRYRNMFDRMVSYLEDGKGVIINKTTGEKYYITSITSGDYSTVGNGYIRFTVDTPSNYFDTTDTWKWLIYFLDNEFMIEDAGLGTDMLLTSTLPVGTLVGSGSTSSYNAGVIGKYSNIYLDYYNGIINSYDYFYQYNTSSYDKAYMKMWIQDTDKVYVQLVSDKTTTAVPKPILDWESGSPTYDFHFVAYSEMSNYRQTVDILEFVTANMPDKVYEIKVDKMRYTEIYKGSFLESYYDTGSTCNPKKFARVLSTTIDTVNTNLKVIKTDLPIKITTIDNGGNIEYQTNLFPQIDTYVSTYKGIRLDPFIIHPDSIPNNTEARQTTILNTISKNTNLAKGLVNKNKISWRYLVDSFGLGLTEYSKQQYCDLGGMKLNCLGFINTPSAKAFKASSNPSFTNDDRTLNTSYIVTGGNLQKNPSWLWSMAQKSGSIDGRSTVAYFFPYLKISDDQQPMMFPPSSFVATTYMQKFLTSQGTVEPWTICAGISDGRITGILGVEIDLTDEQLVDLYKININPIVKTRTAGWVINSESTAQIYPYSSLSIIHSREVLIELENALYDMLLKYQWKFNTPEIRSEIKYRADKICKEKQIAGALYNFKNICNETNNTNYLIDLQMGCLDTQIEIVKGMAIIVNNITILRKGDIESGGFQTPASA